MYNSQLKRVLVVILAMLLLLSMGACGKSQNSRTPESSGTTSAAEQTEATEKVAEAPKDPFGKYDPPITITAGRKSRPNIKFIEGEDYENNVATREYSNLGINLKFDWIVDESQYESKVNLVIASGDIPDTFDVTPAQEQQLIDAGLIQDITEIFDEYASPLMKKILKGDPLLYKTILVDKKLYDIPFMPSKDFAMNILYIRQDWLDNLGLAAPKTADEFWNVLDAFVNRDPDGNNKKDTLGISFNKDITIQPVGVGDIGPMFEMYHAYPGAWLKDASGKLVYGSTLPEMKLALENMQNLYKRGLIDQEFAVKDQGKVAQDIVAGKLGVEFGQFWSPMYPWNDLKKSNPKADLACLDIPSLDGKPVKSVLFLSPLHKLVISKECKHPEAVIKMLNVTEECLWGTGELSKKWAQTRQDPKYKEVESNFHNYWLMGMEPPSINYELVKEVTDAVDAKNPDVALTQEGKLEASNILKYLNEGDLTQWGMWKLRYGPNSGTGVGNARQDAGALIMSEFYGSPGPVQTEKSMTLQKMEREIITKIIMNEAPVSDYDKFIEQWKASGGDDLTAEINAWYEKNK